MSAAEARQFLHPHAVGASAICSRAYAGLIKARAKLFISQGVEHTDIEVPREFWAKAGAALRENWVTGDFEKVVPGKMGNVRLDRRQRAFGVTFRRQDIEQLKPASIAANPAPPPALTAANPASSRAPVQRPAGRTVFIGHGGHSSEWLKLEKFLKDRLHLSPVEFNSTSVAGRATSERLMEMLDQADFAFLILTGEDEKSNGKLIPRLNVVHEAGLFQGKLGFENAIILLEEGCEKFSNVHGLTDVPFPKGKIEFAFEQVRGVLEREELIYRAVVERDSATQHADAVAQKLKGRAKDLLGKALATGQTIFADSNLTDEQLEQKAREWVTHTRDLIAAAYGDGEAALFLDSSGYTFCSDSRNPQKSKIQNWIDGRMRRIGDLLRRADSLTVRSEFEPAKFD
jgi:predicted nucleotide-binding protein